MGYNPLVSFIVPVYNSEKYIGKCIDSILNQTSSNFEIIIIDDGSTDNSLKICREYEVRYSNIKVFTQTNQGVSIARNNGIDESNGEWIAFVDSDDEIVNDYVESVNQYVNDNDYDLVIFDYAIKGREKASIEESGHYNIFTKKENMYLVECALKNSNNDAIWGNLSLRSPCSRVYSSSFLKKENIKFIPYLKMGEDLIFNINAYLMMNRLCYVKKELYIVEERADSVSRGYISNMSEVDKLFYDNLKMVFSKQKIPNSIWDLYYEEAFVGIMRCMRYQYFNKKCDLSYKDIKVEINKIVESEPYSKAIEIVKANGTLKRKLIAWLLYMKCFYILKIFYNLKR